MVDKPTPSEIIESCLRAIELNPNDSRTYNNLGVAYKNTGKLDDAEAAYRKAVDIDPKHAKAHKNLASVRFMVGFRDDAVAMLEKASEIDPGLGSAYFELSQICLFEKQYSAATDYYDKAIQNNLGDIPGYRDAIESKMGLTEQPEWNQTRLQYRIDSGLSQIPDGTLTPEQVIFFSCPPELSDVARANLSSLKRSNPDIPIYVANNILSEDRDYRWHNNDQIFFKWFMDTDPPGKRFALLDYDMYCTIPLDEFYKSVWEADVASSQIIRTGSEWFWWREVGRFPEKFRSDATGIAPLAGSLFSRRAMEMMSPVVCEIEDVFCELRTGTIATHLGLKIVEGKWESIKARQLENSEITEPGLYHEVKHIVM